MESGKFLNKVLVAKVGNVGVLIPLESGKFLNEDIEIHSIASVSLNPFGVREVSKQMKCGTRPLQTVLIPLESGKFLNASDFDIFTKDES